jgi:hypothetical protein
MRKESVGLEHHPDMAPIGRQGCDILSIEQDSAHGGAFESGDHTKRGGLPAPARAEQRNELAPLNGEVNIVDCCHVPETFRQMD